MAARLKKALTWLWAGVLSILKWPGCSCSTPRPPNAPAPDVENQAGRGDNGEGRGQPAPPGQTTSTPGASQTSQPDTGGGAGEMNGVVNAAGIVGSGAGVDPSSGQTTELFFCGY
jgi:hypothetical protein